MIKEYRDKGMSIREIARKMGHCRKTVRKYLKLEGRTPIRKPRPSVGSKIDPFLPYIARVLSEDHEMPATVLHHQIVAMGYKGSVRRVHPCSQGELEA